ncbi:PP2C family protein-serine/threonine phosphatase [Mesotoga prima]|jgi:sigma-B regulation protein RsbU (phosphoserine phosphatase)|uniref:PP2C family protein-serine/threonine phosphatase n=1 Tax=Mesotoga prima TaxID=1184387 RepID=UPI002FE185C7
MGKVLVVDDDRSIRVLLKSILVRDQHDVVECADGLSAFKIATEEQPELVLLDLMLPDCNGLEVLADFKNNSNLEPIPVIVLTGSSDRESRLKALSSGAVDFISKPFLPEEVLLRVNTQLKLHNLIKSLRVAIDSLQNDVLAAGRIQTALVPISPPPELSVAWTYLPSYRVGGDIFDIIRIDETRFFVYLADMSGHGVNAAMLSVMVHRFIEDYKNSIEDSGFDLKDFMIELDRNFRFEKFNLFFTIVSAVIDFKRRIIHFSNAGHPSPLVANSEKCKVLSEEKEGLIGMDMIDGKVCELQLSEGDRFIMYTDGFTEATNETGEMLGEEKLKSIIQGCHGKSLSETIDSLNSEFRDFCGSVRSEDDISVMIIEM